MGAHSIHIVLAIAFGSPDAAGDDTVIHEQQGTYAGDREQ